MGFYADKKVLVTGGGGFLASHLAPVLLARGARVQVVGRRARPPHLVQAIEYLQGDLLDGEARRRALREVQIVFHLAAVGWGLHENMRRRPQLLTDNVLLDSAMLNDAYRSGVERYLYTSSSAVYPGYLDELPEDAPWDQPPHDSELEFGWAKRMGELQAQAYHRHYRMPIAIVRPSNPYGPYDNFDPDKSHVVPALIRRAIERERPFQVWGTGRAARSFVHARDVAEMMVRAIERDPECEPINLASAETITIASLVKLILQISDYADAEVRFDAAKPDGHPRKVPDVRRAAERLRMTGYTPLRDGLAETVQWYRRHLNGGQAAACQ